MLDLEAIELIKQLKARYFRCIDTCNVEELEKTVFTADARVHFKSPSYEIQLQGWKAQLRDFYQQAFTPTKFGMHQGHHPEITVTADTASGLWYLHDMFFNLEQKTIIQGSALYEDDYVRVDGQWRISQMRYERLLEFISPLPPEMTITARPVR